MGFYNFKMYFFDVEVEIRAKNEHFQVTIFSDKVTKGPLYYFF